MPHIGDHVQNANNDAKHDSHRNADNRKTDAVEHRSTEGDESLAAEVPVHVIFDIVFDAVYSSPIFMGHEHTETAHQRGVVDKDENDIDKRQQPFKGMEQEIDCRTQ